MEINNLENSNEINMNKKLVDETTQRNFLQTTLGKTINTAVDIGIRTILPNFLEDQVINIKDNLLKYGLIEGIRKTIDDTIDIGKSAIGIVTGNFENISQMRNAIQTGGLIDSMSSLLDTVVDKIKEKGLINNKIANTIKQGKNTILNNIENNIEGMFNKQYEAFENMEKYINNWKGYFREKNFSGMQKEYNKMQKQLENIAPIEKTINDIKTINVLHNLIKGNGRDFNLTQEELELAEKLK